MPWAKYALVDLKSTPGFDHIYVHGELGATRTVSAVEDPIICLVPQSNNNHCLRPFCELSRNRRMTCAFSAMDSKNCRHDIAVCVPDEGVDVLAFDVVQRLDRVLDLPLVGLHVHDEHEGVVVLNLLHRALGRERELDHSVLGHLRLLFFRIKIPTARRGDMNNSNKAQQRLFAGSFVT